ncbi:GTP 3',8-cyclase MoaA [Acetobacter sicerae]|uniref:GTP 3',8-cyclase n=1 Tax=Acetobacter sicerae TaxID=85325 RepID=A0ABS8VVC4_9PROT|nr:GTP 3',8-cyclase MoaA [Acetobacter sicerae]MCE0744134.1 GTP 3',8-cyclase MoaA [Acetobacter sicerae]
MEVARDLQGRPLRDLRISVMDRCNFRCPYCMPEAAYPEGFRFLKTAERLDFDEIERVARVAAGLGVTKLRLTGGEPLLRPNLPDLVARLVRIPGIRDVALTTNGVLLERHAAALCEAGLSRVTISLDSLDPAIFVRLSGGRAELSAVLRGVGAACHAGFPGAVKINTVVQRGVNDAGVPDLLDHFRNTGVVVRLIEYMDVGNRNGWSHDDVVPSSELLRRIQTRWPLEALDASYRGEVARRYRYADGGGEIGFISSVTAPFCGSCSRARLSSDGQLYTCLFATKGADLRAVLRDDRNNGDEQALRQVLVESWCNRADQYSEDRAQAFIGGEAALVSRKNEKIEMHYIGG